MVRERLSDRTDPEPVTSAPAEAAAGGRAPFPEPGAFAADVAAGQVRYALLSDAAMPTPTTAWIRAACRPVGGVPTPPTVVLFDCLA